jgi:hypothetical protein
MHVCFVAMNILTSLDVSFVKFMKERFVCVNLASSWGGLP